ncbi:hypothetical protein L873DRAFT_118732 [Choiromyces venosus 120613-1]|uniref:Uncharacterized protein n=1 Tax=Choiromyces venosus 120613-1 TaxID=1336337 RepID=A0A3N4J3V8_9PEZI|nr:hypothetical protein L873DRAFT_118732 [Choiromyces venosus 120613-1]
MTYLSHLLYTHSINTGMLNAITSLHLFLLLSLSLLSYSTFKDSVLLDMSFPHGGEIDASFIHFLLSIHSFIHTYGTPQSFILNYHLFPSLIITFSPTILHLTFSNLNSGLTYPPFRKIQNSKIYKVSLTLLSQYCEGKNLILHF